MATTSFAPLARYVRFVCQSESDSDLLRHFARHADESAFAEIVRRHGPAVLGVCRRVLRDDHAAEDAFQATFLLLAKKAGSLFAPDRLASWLHGVAYRTALKLRSRLARRSSRERPFDEAAYLTPDRPDSEIGPALDAAIEQLPSKYRVPVVLCYLQGLTNAEAAAALGCPANTIATRLARARQRLRGRLEKQGLTAAVSAGSIAATARNAVALANGTAVLSSEIITLMEGVRNAMMWKKLKIVVATVAILTLTGVGANRFAFQAVADQPTGGKAVPPPSASPPSTAPTGTKPAADLERIPPVHLTAPETLSKNFAVTCTTPELGREIANAAESLRRDLAQTWLKVPMLPDWPMRCPIHVAITGYGEPSSSSTEFAFDKEFRIIGMKLNGSREQILANLLPHEISHIVLAEHFRRPIPRWADEGVAALAESAAEQIDHDQRCRQALNAGKAFRLQFLFGLMAYPNDVETFHVQSYSVARFLVEKRDNTTFLEFIKVGMKDGWEAAAKLHYNFRSIRELEETWIASSRPHRKTPSLPPTDPTNLPIVGPFPGPELTKPPAPSVETTPPLKPNVPLEPPTRNASPMPPMRVPEGAFTPTLAATVPSNPIIVVEASMVKDGIVLLKFPKMTHYEPVTNYAEVKGQHKPVTSYVSRTTQEERGYKLEHLKIVGKDGKPVGVADIEKRLSKPTLIVFVAQYACDPRLLSMLNADTLIVFAPRSHPPAPPISMQPN